MEGLGLQEGIGLAAPAEQPSLLDVAKSQYPFLKDANISFTRSPENLSEGRKLEYWGPQDLQWKWKGKTFTRPEALPLGSHGLEVFSSSVRPIDLLGDFISHGAVKEDPKLKAIYDEFSKSLAPELMYSRYQHHKKLYGENRSYGDWLEKTGIPEIFRGYTFNQWPTTKTFKPADMYTPEQLKLLDRAKEHIGIP